MLGKYINRTSWENIKQTTSRMPPIGRVDRKSKYIYNLMDYSIGSLSDSKFYMCALCHFDKKIVTDHDRLDRDMYQITCKHDTISMAKESANIRLKLSNFRFIRCVLLIILFDVDFFLDFVDLLIVCELVHVRRILCVSWHV